ncbi:MAG: hypothetical protein AAGM40_08690 [Cyanobacteria bacterium J06573_2]
MIFRKNSIQHHTSTAVGKELQELPKLELEELEDLSGGAEGPDLKSMDENIAEVVVRWNETFGDNFGSIMWL